MDWESLNDLVVPQGNEPRDATPDDVRKMVSGLLEAAHDANETRWIAEREKSRICRAIGHYAAHQPLDSLSARQIQSDLFAICGERHAHRISIGSDACDLCGYNWRHEIHLRAGEPLNAARETVEAE